MDSYLNLYNILFVCGASWWKYKSYKQIFFVCLHKFHVDYRKIDINLPKLYPLFKT